MKQHPFLAAFVFTLAFLAASNLQAASFTWGGGSGNWTSGANWSPEGVPGPGDTATINSGTVTVNQDVIVDEFIMLGGVLTGSFDLEVNVATTWSAGVMTGGGSLTIPSGATLSIEGSTNKAFQNLWTINLEGDGTLSGSGLLQGHSDSRIINTGTFEIQSDQAFDYTNLGARPTFDNRGTFRKTTTNGQNDMEFELVNSGIVDLQSGDIRLLANGDFTDGATFMGAGNLIMDGFIYTLTGTINGSSWEFRNGSLQGGGTVADTLLWTGGDLSGGAHSLTIAATGTLLYQGSSNRQLTNGFTLNNMGTITFDGTGFLQGSNASTLNNFGLIDLKTTFTFDYTNISTRPAINNSGTFQQSAGDSPVNCEFAMNNTGLVHSQVVNINLSGGGVSTGEFRSENLADIWFTGATSELMTGTELSGAGFVRLRNDSLEVSGAVTASGSFEMSGTSSPTLLGTGTLTVTGEMGWLRGTLSGAGTVLIANGAELVIGASETYEIRNGRIIRNEGTITWAGGHINGQNTATIENAGTFIIQNDFSLDFKDIGTRPIIVNTGTIRKISGTGATLSEFELTNSGTIDVQTGTIGLRANATLEEGSNITGAGRLQMIFGDFLITGGVTGDALELADGNLLGGDGTIHGTLHWTDGIMRGGLLNISATGTLAISGAPNKTITNTFQLENAGTIDFSGTGLLHGSNGAIISTSGTLIMRDDTFFDFTNVGTRPIINNSGTLRRTGSNGVASIEFVLNNESTGVVETTQGILGVIGGGTSTGQFDVPTGGFIFQTAPYILGEGATLIGASGAFVIESSGVLIVNGNIPASADIELESGGELGGPGNLTTSAVFRWKGGVLSGSGTTTIDAMGTLNIFESNNKVLDTRTLINNGHTQWAQGHILGRNDAAIVNTGTWDFFTDDSIDHNNIGGRSTFTNTGTMTKSIATGTTIMDFTFINSGTVDMQTGILNLVTPAQLNNGSMFTGDGVTQNQATGSTLSGNIGGDSLELASGSVNGEPTITGTVTWSGGSMTGATTFTIANSANLVITGSNSKTLDGGITLDNQGMVFLSSDNDLRGINGATLLNQGFLFLEGDRGFDYTNIGDRPELINIGAISKTSGSGSSMMDFTLVNSGQIDVQSGFIDVVVPAQLNDGSNFTGAGRTLLRATGNALSGTIAGTALQLIAGTITGDATFTGVLSWTGGTITGTSTLTIDAGALLLITGANTKSLQNGVTLSNSGTVIHAGENAINGNNGALVSNSGLFDIQGDQGFDYTNLGDIPAFSNLAGGTLRKSGGLGSALFDFEFTNSGELQAQAGTIDFKRSFTQTDGTTSLQNGDLASTQTMQFQNGELTGTGTITGNVNLMSTQVSPGTSSGSLNIDGDFTQSADSPLAIEIGGTTPGTGFDQLTVSGTATLNGALNLSTINAYTTTEMDTFEIVSAGTLTGAFTSITGTSIGGGLFYTQTYSATSVVLGVADATPSLVPTSLGFSGGDFGFQLRGIAQLTYRIEATADFSMWDELETITLMTPTYDFMDADSDMFPHRFYRIVLVDLD